MNNKKWQHKLHPSITHINFDGEMSDEMLKMINRMVEIAYKIKPKDLIKCSKTH